MIYFLPLLAKFHFILIFPLLFEKCYFFVFFFSFLPFTFLCISIFLVVFNFLGLVGTSEVNYKTISFNSLSFINLPVKIFSMQHIFIKMLSKCKAEGQVLYQLWKRVWKDKRELREMKGNSKRKKNKACYSETMKI